MKRAIFLMVAAAFFSGCSLYKSYQRGDVNTTGLYRDSVAATDTATIGSLSWRELFTDSILTALIEKGLELNTDIKIAHLKTEQAKATLMSSRLAYLPSLAVNAQGMAGSSHLRTYNVGASASWEIDIFGKLTAAKREARSAMEQSQAYEQAVQTGLISSIAQSYYTLLMLDAQVHISELAARNWAQNIATLVALKAAGQASEAAVAQASANHLAVEASVLTLKQQINITENSLSTLIGVPAGKISRTELAAQSFPLSVAVGVPLQMLSNRPDVKQAEAALAAAYYSTQAARAAFYPSITLSGSGGWTGSGGAIVSPAALIGQVVGSLVQPIFNRGHNVAQLRIARAAQEQASLTFKQSLLDAGAEVNDALTAWQTARSRIAIDDRQIEFLKIAVKSTSLLMEHGTTTYLEVLIAQQTLLQAELVAVANRIEQIQNVITLYHALGGGRF